MSQFTINLKPLADWTDQELQNECNAYSLMINEAENADQETFLRQCKEPILQEMGRRVLEGLPATVRASLKKHRN